MESGCLPLRAIITPNDIVVAWTFTSSSLSFGIGFSTSFIIKTSGGPYLSYIIAFISIRLWL
ncbi:MAG: hypothetical protein ACFFB8_06465 [Promethearchaeota archaeon]